MAHPILTHERLSSAMPYEAYYNLHEQMVASGATTGPTQSPELATYTKLNLQRTKRVYKTMPLAPEMPQLLRDLPRPQLWVVLTETWCGDAAQLVPALARLAEASDGKATVMVLLRDENLDVMDKYLTNGGRAIPILIALDAETLHELWHWGPRPAPAQQMVRAYKENANGEPFDDFKIRLQSWYNTDQGATLQAELAALTAKVPAA